jgi:hypothetical protein
MPVLLPPAGGRSQVTGEWEGPNAIRLLGGLGPLLDEARILVALAMYTSAAQKLIWPYGGHTDGPCASVTPASSPLSI